MAFDKNHTSLFMKIVIIFFAVVLVVSLCLPFFSGCTQRSSSTSNDDAQDSAQSDSTSSNTVSGVEAQYSTLISSLTEKLEGDPDSLAYLANLGNAYMNSGLAMMAASDADSFAEKVEASFASAVGYYDRYLEIASDGSDAADQESINTVSLKKALCQYDMGDTEQAVKAVEDLVADQPDYAMGWYELGTLYEQEGDSEKAREAYNKAVEADGDASSMASLNAQFRLMVLDAVEAQQQEGSSDGSADEASDAEAASSGTDSTSNDGEGSTDTDDTSSDADGAADDAADDASAQEG